MSCRFALEIAKINFSYISIMNIDIGGSGDCPISRENKTFIPENIKTPAKNIQLNKPRTPVVEIREGINPKPYLKSKFQKLLESISLGLFIAHSDSKNPGPEPNTGLLNILLLAISNVASSEGLTSK